MKNLTRIAVPLLALALAACGTTSGVRSDSAAGGKTSVPALGGYERVAVLDFTDATDTGNIKEKDLQSHNDKVAIATRTFADLIALKLRESGAFTEVVRGSVDGKVLTISGNITRYAEGNSAARLLVGFGAGSAYFDATTYLKDGESGATVGNLVTDKNSWALGGAIAAAQNVQSFMEGAAKKIASEVVAAKRGPEASKKAGR